MKCERMSFFFLNCIGAESVNKRGNNINSRKFKREKEGIMHLLMASFRALPLDLMMPVSVSASDSLDFFFFLVNLSSFLFLSWLLFTDFLSPNARLSGAVGPRTFAHAHIATFARNKCQKKSLVRLSRELTAV